jgi:regulator of replication initiation timing
MSPDMTALIQQVQEATRQMDLAAQAITAQKARIAELEEENERLRLRLVKAMKVIEHYESPEQ